MQPPQLKDEDLPAAFWETLPENAENADLAAIRSLEAESTPEERAESFKACKLQSDSLLCMVLC